MLYVACASKKNEYSQWRPNSCGSFDMSSNELALRRRVRHAFVPSIFTLSVILVRSERSSSLSLPVQKSP